MSAEQLALVGSRLVKRCGTRDPFEIAADIGVEVMFCDNFGPLKGMYRVIKRNRFIFINNQLSEQMQRIVCAHELGHDQLHRNLAKDNPLRELCFMICAPNRSTRRTSLRRRSFWTTTSFLSTSISTASPQSRLHGQWKPTSTLLP